MVNIFRLLLFLLSKEVKVFGAPFFVANDDFLMFIYGLLYEFMPKSSSLSVLLLLISLFDPISLLKLLE